MSDPLEEQAAAKKALTLKFEYDGQQYELASLTTADTVGNLRAVVCSMLNIDDFNKINLKTLQPTKIIDTTDDSRSLSEIFRQTRERIVVEDVLTPGTYASTSSSNNYDLDKNSTQSGSRLSPSFSVKHHKASDANSRDGQPSVPTAPTASDFIDYEGSNSQDQFSFLPAPSAFSESSTRRNVTNDQTDYPVCSSTGYLLRHPVPSNNSCLFISVHFCLTHGIVDDQIGKSMRKIIADTVASDKQHFDDAFLGKSNADYCKWILDDNNWGGAIELSILCKYYETEIVAIDVKNTILNRFGEDSHYPKRMLLLYDGLHYDPLKFQPLDDSHSIQTLFSSENTEVLSLAEELAKEAKQSHQFTDMKTITMKCGVCNAELDAKTATEHAAKTGHVDFIEK